jgi:hypothetical protein
MKSYTLGASEMFNTAGVLRWAIAGYRVRSQRRKMLDIFRLGFHGPNTPSVAVWKQLLDGKIAWEAGDNGSVTFSA